MSIARHHNEWLSLIEISGPFLSLPVLMRVFPQGLDALDGDGLTELRLAYEEWLDDQNSLRPSPAIHSVWARYVLEHVLGFEKVNLLEGPAIPATLQAYIAEQGETLHPDLVIANPLPQAGEGALGVRVLVQVYPITQGLEKSMQNHRWKASPAMRMLELLRASGVSLGLVTNGEQWMLVNAPKGETSAFVSWYAALWLEEPLTLRAFSSLLGATRFFSVADEDTPEGMLKDSVNEQQEVTDQLGYQVRRAVEVLIRAVDKADQDRGRAVLKDIRESDLYEAALTVMMRLVFLFSAEERGLLLLGDPLYDQNYAVSTLRAQLRETADQQGEEVLERRFDAWCRLLATFRAVHDGIHHDRLNLPAYGGSLFDPDRYPFLEGRSYSPLPVGEGKGEGEVLPISNRTVLHLLEALQILRVKVPGGGPAEARRLSFRALDVEQIGHVYEGLLDHIAVRAGEPVLGLAGTRQKEPEIPLPILLAEEARGEKSFLAFLKEQTERSENALRKALQQKPDVFTSQHLQIACNNDAKMFERVAKFAGLVHADDFGYPAVFLPGSVYVTAGATRRATGTHYTPRSLTEPIVQHTLEPLVYTGPAEGLPKEEWKLKSPAELLELKVCDMAMGSAGFLVQVVRYLSERLVEAWDNLTHLTPSPSPERRGELRITPEGKPATGKPGELILPQDDDERLVLARRLVADRCIYGVDKNPLAVEIAKLSIWLTTMDKGRPFTFLDHALKCGDSLVGADEDMYRKWAYNLKGAQFTLYLTTLEEMVAAARQKRKELESFTVLDVRDAEHKAQLLKEADDAMARVKLGCDLLVGVHLLRLKAADQERLLSHLLWDYVAGLPMDTPDAQRALAAACKERAFHWPFEFPEVFATEGKGGFSAFVGNPPFQSGKSKEQSIAAIYGDEYVSFLEYRYIKNKRSADICSYFFLLAFNNLRVRGTYGLIATNSISEGTTREVGLDLFSKKENGQIYRAIDIMPWPGSAAVRISVIHATKQIWRGKIILNSKEETWISPRLEASADIGEPYVVNKTLMAYHGTKPRGDFSVGEDEVVMNASNSQYLPLFLSGQDVNSKPGSSASRRIIHLPFETEQLARQADERLFMFLKEKVYAYRFSTGIESLMKFWWRYEYDASELYDAISEYGYSEIYASCRVSNYFSLNKVNADQIFSDGVVVFLLPSDAYFSILQSSIFQVWVRKYCATFKEDIRLNVKDVISNYVVPDISSNQREENLLTIKW